jgi:hypothetical protein
MTAPLQMFFMVPNTLWVLALRERGGIRTRDIGFRRAALYPLSYASIAGYPSRSLSQNSP